MPRYKTRYPAIFYFAAALALLALTSLPCDAAVNVDFGMAAIPSYSGIGVVSEAGAYWNAISGSQPQVCDSGGAATSVGVEFGSDTQIADWYAPLLAPDLMKDYLYSFSPDVDQVWIIGLDPNETYDLYLYSQNGSSANAKTTFTVGGLNKTVTNAGNGGSFVLGRNYTVYTGVSPAADGRLSIQYSDAKGVGSTLNGFQLVGDNFITVPEFGEPSRGRQIILDRGLQIQALNSLRGYSGPLDIDRWLGSNFTTINFFYDPNVHQTELARLPAGTLWGRADQSKAWYAGEAPYADNLVSVQYYDEISPFDPGMMADMTDAFATWRGLAPNALAHTNFWGGQLSASQLNTFMVTARPDMLMFDHYPGYHATRESWYAEMQKYRTIATLGYDGTGRQPIPYGQWLQTFRTSYSEPLPSETFLRRQQFASWAFGFTFLGAFVYSDGCWPYPPLEASEVIPVMFKSPGDTEPITPMFDYVAETNRQSRNLGPALIRMVSTDVRMILGKSGGATNPSISGISTWTQGGQNTAGYTDYITDIVPLGQDLLNPDYNNFSDTIVGYFRPLLADNTVYTFVDGLCFMIVNGAGNESGLDIPVDGNGDPDPAIMAAGTAEALGEWYHVAFDFADSNIDSLVRLSRDTGEVELVPLIHYADSQYYFNLYLPGGTGDLFAFWDSSTMPLTVSGHEIVVGDANGDGMVDNDDAVILAANWHKNGGATWAQGDFNSDGNIDDVDATLLAVNWSMISSATAGTSVPEPGVFMLLACGLLILICRNWRWR